MVFDLWLVNFDPLCVFLCFKVRCLWSLIMIDGSEKRNYEGGFWTLEFACLWKAQISFPLLLSLVHHNAFQMWRNSKILPKYFLNWLIKI